MAECDIDSKVDKLKRDLTYTCESLKIKLAEAKQTQKKYFNCFLLI
jgi:hypothetical protein